jgi:type IV secretory pathway VirB4 component
MFEDGICEVTEGLYSKTIKFSDMNYQIARREDQVEIFSKYCEFLNYFDSSIPIQITIVNRTVDKAEFKKQMFLKMHNDEIDIYREEYNQMLNDKAHQGQNSILREKYLTFSATAPNYKAAIPILSRIETDILGNFKSLGCDTKVLSGCERLELLYNAFNYDKEPFSFKYDQLIASDLKTKDFISPDSFGFSNKSRFEFGNKYGQVLYLKDLPPDLSDKLLSEISDIPVNMSINLHINSVDQDNALDLVKKKIAFMEQQKIDEQKKALKAGYDVDMLPYELKFSLNEAAELLDDLQNKNQRMFKATILIFTSADSPEDLEKNVYQISSAARKNNCKIGNLDYLQEEGMNSSLPLGKNHIEIQRTLTTSSTAIFIPFTTVELFQKGGMYYGLNALSRNLIFFDRKSLKNANGFILGTPGSGKSFAGKREMVNVLLNSDDEVLVIDPEREYTPLAKGFNGEIIHISAGSKTHINPLDITMDYSDDDNPLLLKSEFILSLCELLVGGRGGLSAAEKTVIDRSVKLTYANYFSNSKNKTVPTLLDFHEVLKNQPEQEATNIALALELYVTGSLGVFAQPTNIDIKNRFVIYDIKDLGKQLRTMGMLIVLDQIWNRITLNRAIGKRTWIYMDEIYLLFQNEYSANYLFELYKRARKWGAIPTGITQNIEDLLISDLARRMLSNSDYIMMLNQAPSDRAELASLLNISSQQLSYVTNANAGQGLLFSGTSIIPFIDKFPTETRLYKMMTTKPEEVQRD